MGKKHNMQSTDWSKALLSITQQALEQAQESKQALNKHPLKPLLYQVLCELKRSATPQVDLGPFDSDVDEQLVRLDTMLIAEGVALPDVGNSICAFESRRVESRHAFREIKVFLFGNAQEIKFIDLKSISQLNHCYNNKTLESADVAASLETTEEYRAKLEQIRTVYRRELEKYEQACNEFCTHVLNLLREQATTRPIGDVEIDRMVQIIRKRFARIQVQLKQNTCEAIMMLRSRLLDARLSNWFGNKRIRYKKNIGKNDPNFYKYATGVANNCGNNADIGSGDGRRSSSPMKDTVESSTNSVLNGSPSLNDRRSNDSADR
ncbi:hypothetical protein ACOME3_010580 [Neoechinorhynchus agilis]